MRCLVIGGSGFIGGAIVAELRRQGDAVDIADRHNMDITNYDDVYTMLHNGQYDEVYHMAGVLGTSELNSEISYSIRVNVLGTVNVMAACKAVGIPVLFYPSKPNPWLNMYTITKYASEQIGRLFNKESDLDVVSLRYFNVYGPGQHTHPVRKLLPTWCLSLAHGYPLQIYGTGQNVIDVISAKDTAYFTVLATRERFTNKVYDLGSGQGKTVNRVAQDLCKVVGAEYQVEYLPMRSGEDENTTLVADMSDFPAQLMYEEYEDTLRECYAYYLSLPPYEAAAALRHHGIMK